MSEATKTCPICGEAILAVAKKCRFCGEYFDPADRKASAPPLADRMLLPVGRPVSAIAAGYLGLTAFFPFIGLFLGIGGVVCGVLALKTINRDSSLSGKGRAWFGIVAGGFCAVVWLIGWISVITVIVTDTHRH